MIAACRSTPRSPPSIAVTCPSWPSSSTPSTTSQLWAVLPGVTNSAGNLMLHLNGNLREFIGRQIGGVAYTRDRPREFAARDVPRAELAANLAALPAVIAQVLESMTDSRWDEMFPEQVLGAPVTNRQFVVHLYGHLNYHLGQIDYLRRDPDRPGCAAAPRVGRRGSSR